jgi:hypothetical protein
MPSDPAAVVMCAVLDGALALVFRRNIEYATERH